MDWQGLFQLAAIPIVIVVLWVLFQYRWSGPPQRRSAAVVVLGDIGRSPRIMYHAQSFALNDFETYVVGYKGVREIPLLLTLPRVQFVYLPVPPPFIAKMPRQFFLILAPLKVTFQLVTIIAALFYRIEHSPEFILVQRLSKNPPSIPTLVLVWLVGKFRGSKVIIDWHNLGYSILALKLGNSHILVRLAKIFERTFGRSAFSHLFVTRAMRDNLVAEWNLRGHKIVLHDRPPSHFHPSSPSEVHDLFCRITPSIAPALSTFLLPYDLPTSTPFTALAAQDSLSNTPSPLPTLRSDRPALVVSSTSWTEDEDFNILIAALKLYEQQARLQTNIDGGHLPKILVIVTGKGPLRDHYIGKVRELEETQRWEWVRCRSLWLEPEDYPLLLGSADIGVSLHASSSALDLPMKVVDMFGCGLPVLALDFNCLDELVLDGNNGLVFRTADELALHLTSTLMSFPISPRLSALRAFFSTKSGWDWCSWNENWDRVLRPIVTHEIASEDTLLEENFRRSAK